MNHTIAAAFQHNGIQVQRDHFYAIACNPNRSVAVEACAGAGKTWMLVSRIVRALLQGTKPHEILAITFTKKAAGEMRQRLQEWLLAFSQADDATLRDELRARGWTHEPTSQDIDQLRNLHHELLKANRGVQIRTFHGWFAALVRSSPMQTLQNLGLPTQYELLQDDSEAIEQVWSRFYQIIAANKESEARTDYLMLVAEYGRHQAQQALKEALNKRVEFNLADQQGIVESSVAFEDAPEAWFTSPPVQDVLWQAARVLGASKLATCIKAASALEKALTHHDIPAQIGALLTTSGTPRKFSEKLIGLDTVQIAQDYAMDFEAKKLQHHAWLHQQRMARLARILIAEYAQLKRESHWLDMNDLERTALTLLSDEILSGWVQERLDAQICHLLIDEFQDTNPLQWQALYAWLTGYTGAGKAISVFLVGDPKQSIYRFRRAEPQVFKAAQAFVQEGLMGDLLNCDHTRRNARSIMDRVNQVMAQAQDEGVFSGFRPHSTESDEKGTIWNLPRIGRPARAKATEEAEIGIDHWRDSLTEARHTEEETRKTLECRQAAQWLAQYVQTGAIQAGDVMVLSRKRERLNLMQIELNALRIPAQQPEKNELADMPEVQDIIALLDVLVSPQHNLSFARVLKSPIFDFNDDDLVQIALKANAPEPLSPPLIWWDVAASDTRLEALARWKILINSLPPHDALATIYTEGEILEKYASAALPAQRESVLANLRALLAATLEVDQGRYVTAYSLIRKLKKGGMKAPVRANSAAVQLLTVHGAKGLEAKLVLMLDTDAEAKNAPSMGILVDWPGENLYPQRFVFLASEARVPPCTAQLLKKEKTERAREELNALYVALTRCRHTLVFSSLQAHRGQNPSWWERLLPHAEEEINAVNHATTTATTAFAATAVAAIDVDVDVVAETTFEFNCLPSIPLVNKASKATDLIAEEDDLDSRMGQAMHRLLERYTPRKGFSPPERIAKEFNLSSEQMAMATKWAQSIVTGEGAWAWDSAQLVWEGNEVSIHYQRELLRIDRLVQNIKGQWWILDYKSAHQPELDSELRYQLLRYRAAISHVYQQQRVRTAFLTAQGKLIEI